MSEESDTNQSYSLKWAMINLRLIGGYTTKRTILSYISIASMFMAFAFMVVDLCINVRDIESLKRITFLPNVFLCFFKGFSLLSKSKEVVDMVHSVRFFWRANKFDLKTEQEVKTYFNNIGIIQFAYSIFVLGLSTMMIIMPLLNLEKRSLIYSDFTFCNIQNWFCWTPMYIWQLLAYTIQMLPSALSFDCFFITLIGYIMMACKLLKRGLQQLDTDNLDDRRFYLKEIVKQHDFILKFLNFVNDLYTIPMLIQFYCALGSMTLLLNMMAANGLPPKAADLSYFGMVYIIVVFRIFLYATGGAIVEDVLYISTDIYMVNWYDKNRTDLRKDLSLMIFRAQRTKILNVGKMSDLNYPLFVATIKNSFSVVTLIWQVANQDTIQQT